MVAVSPWFRHLLCDGTAAVVAAEEEQQHLLILPDLLTAQLAALLDLLLGKLELQEQSECQAACEVLVSNFCLDKDLVCRYCECSSLCRCRSRWRNRAKKFEYDPPPAPLLPSAV